jgi:hypothetical protein
MTCECRTPHRLSERAVFNKSKHSRSRPLSKNLTGDHAFKVIYPSMYFYVALICQYCVLISCHTQFQTLLQEQEPEIHFEAATIEIPIDHFNPADHQKYTNRFWTNDTFYRKGGPVLFYDAGERGVSDGNLVSLSDESHVLMNLTRTFHGLAVIWEHRFYGQSIPFPLDIDSTNAEKEAAYRVLDTEQALEDAVFFASHFETTHADLKPNATPWIWIGGSYPGHRAAMIRNRNPDIFFASYSSSAAVEVRMSLPEYYLHISHDLPAKCGDIVRQAVRYADGILQNGSYIAKSRLRWAIARRWPADKTTRMERLLYALAAPDFPVASHFTTLVAADWQWRGMGTNGRMAATCASIESAEFDSASHSSAAIETILDAVEANNRHFAGSSGGSGLSRLDEQAWQYQVCTEYFWLRTTAPHEPYNIISRILTTENLWADTCTRQYPWLNPPLDPKTRAPSLYAGWEKNVSNVMFVTGLRDPWHDVSIAPSKSLVPGAPRDRKMTSKVPRCNELMTGREVFGLMLPEGRHCSDLIAGSRDAEEATELFMKALEAWLPCFGH